MIIMKSSKELSEQTKKDLVQARVEMRAGKFYTLSEIKKEIGLKA